jgi:hypothetical protein
LRWTKPPMPLPCRTLLFAYSPYKQCNHGK